MGEMAEEAVQRILDNEDLRLDFKRGLIPLDEAYELGIIDEDGSEDD